MLKSVHEYRQADFDLLYLVSCALNDVVPDAARVADMDTALVHQIASKHKVDALAAYPLRRLWKEHPAPEEEMHVWLQDEAHAQYREALFDAERKEVMGFLDKAGIWHVALKGSVLRGLYPRPDLRQMCDVDILFDATRRDDVREWFEARGYTPKIVGDNPVDVYKKQPVFNFEMHKRLLSSSYQDPWFSYFLDVRQLLVPVEGTACELRFTDEDCYLYVMTHAAKHYFGSGTGLRALADAFVYNRALGNHMNWQYVHEELEKLELREFEITLCCLAQRVLGDPAVASRLQADLEGFPEQERDMLARILECGAYGTIAQRLRMEMDANTLHERIGALVRRVFPAKEVVQLSYPVIKAHPVLLPVFYVARGIRAFVVPEKRKRTIKTLRALRDLQAEGR